MSNFKFVVLVFVELLAFNGQKVKVSCDPGHAPCSKIFQGSCRDSAMFGTCEAHQHLLIFVPNILRTQHKMTEAGMA